MYSVFLYILSDSSSSLYKRSYGAGLQCKLVVLTLCLMFPCSRLPDLLPPLFHHVCMVLLEDHLHQACKPFQRGTRFSILPACRVILHVNIKSTWWLLKHLPLFFLNFSFACPRLRRSVTRRKRGQRPSKRSYGGLPPVCLYTPAQELEVNRVCVWVCEWERERECKNEFVSVLELSNNKMPVVLTRCSNPLLWPLSSYQARPVSPLLCVRHVRELYLLQTKWYYFASQTFKLHQSLHQSFLLFFFIYIIHPLFSFPILLLYVAGVCWRWITIVPGM